MDGGPLTLQYLLAVDTLNFCFWPSPGLEYEHLARGLKVRCLGTLAWLHPACLPTSTGTAWTALLALPGANVKLTWMRCMRSVSDEVIAAAG